MIEFIKSNPKLLFDCRLLIAQGEPDYLAVLNSIEAHLAQYVVTDNVPWDLVVEALVKDYNKVLPEHLHIVLK